MRSFKIAGPLVFAGSLLISCGGGSSTLTPAASSSVQPLPVSPAFSTTSAVAPPATTTATTLSIPLPPSTGYSGNATLPVASVPANLELTITYANSAPTGVATFASARRTSSQRRPLVDSSTTTTVAYGCFSVNETLNVNGLPQFSFTLPPAFANGSYVYNLAIEQDGPWTTGYGGPGTVVSTASSAVVTVSGRFGFTIPANGMVCVALYAEPTSDSTPIPATPVPSTSPSPVPSVSPSASAVPSVTPTVAPSAGPTVAPTAAPTVAPTATPTPTPTPTPAPLTITPSTVSLLGLGASNALTATVQEAGYSGAFTVVATACDPYATVSPSPGTGPAQVLTITGTAAGGPCTATVTDGFGQMATLTINVTSSGVGVNARRRAR